MNGEARYTLPGVLRFLQGEWQRTERDKIHWDVERAEMVSRITKLEDENRRLQQESRDSQRQVRLLRSRLLRENSGSSEYPDEVVNGHMESKERSECNEAGNGEEIFEEDLKNREHDIEETKRQIAEYSSEIRALVDKTRSLRTEALGDAASQIIEGPSLLHTGAHLSPFDGGGVVWCMSALSNDEIAVGTGDGEILVYSTQTPGSEPRLRQLPFGRVRAPVSAMAYCTSLGELFVTSGTGRAAGLVVDHQNSVMRKTREFETGGLVSLMSVTAGPLLATSVAGKVVIWDCSNPEETEALASVAGSATALEFVELGEDAETILIMGVPGYVRFVDPRTGRDARPFVRLGTASIETPVVAAISMLYQPEESIVVGLTTGDLVILGLQKGQVLAEAVGAHADAITSVVVAPLQNVVLSTAMDGRTSLWSLPNLAWSGRLLNHDTTNGGARVGLWTSGNLLVTGGGDGVVRMYQY